MAGLLPSKWLGCGQYRHTIRKEIYDGVLENNQFLHTADEGLYEGGGTLNEDTFEGYYKGPIGGTYKMWRIKQEACDTAPDKECSDCKAERGLDQ